MQRIFNSKISSLTVIKAIDSSGFTQDFSSMGLVEVSSTVVALLVSELGLRVFSAERLVVSPLLQTQLYQSEN